MTDAELSSIEAAAKAATPGPWKIAFNKDIYHVSLDGNHVDICDNGYDGTGGIQNSKDAAYIAAANPVAILALIAELRQTRAERDWLAEHRPARYCPTVEKWETCLVDVPGHKLPKACIQCWIDRAKEAACQK